MKLKKLFAGIVAVAMMATMAIPGFAATGAVTSKVKQNIGNPGKVNITKVIDGTGYGTESVEFAIDNESKPILVTHNTTLTQEQKDALTISIENAGKKVSISDSSADNTGRATGTLTIQLPEYKSVGTYVYKFHEVAGSTAGMSYDEDFKYLVVNVYNEIVNDETTGKLLVNTVVLNQDPSNELKDEKKGDLSGMTENKIDEINNKYGAGTYTVEKKVKGNMADRQQKFNFVVTFERTAGTTLSGGIKMYKDGHANEVTLLDNTKLTFDSHNQATYPIELTHGEKMHFDNIPYGVTVSVVEVDSADKAVTAGNKNGEYEVAYSEDAAGVKMGTDEGEKITGAATITNKSTVNVNTGVILDNAPYIALLTIVAAGAVVMIMKKRRNYED